MNNVNFAVIASNGIVIKTGSCLIDDLDLQKQDDQFVITHDGNVQDDLHYWKNGEFRVYPEKPSEHHVFNTSSEKWVDPRNSRQLTESLVKTKAAGISKVNQRVSYIRGKYITPILEQGAIYNEKRNEAIAYLADPDPNMDQYPFLSGEVGITAPTAYELAQLWLNLAAIWIEAGAQIEKIRVGANTRIEAATSEEEVTVIVDEATAAFESLVP